MSFPNPPSVNTPIPNQPFSYPEVPATFDRLFGSLVPNIQLEPNPSENQGGNNWVRPADWLAMPTVSATEEKFVGLFAVYDTPENFIAVYFEGDYTVDWGDGTTENFNSGDKAQHSYDWADVSPSTVTSAGYRQVLVTVIPQSGQNLTIMDLTDRHDNIVTNSNTNTPWLDLAVSMPNADSGGSLRFCGYVGNNNNGYLFDVQRIVIVNSGLMDDFTECFYNFTSLRKVEILCSLPVNTNFFFLFDSCYALTDVVLSDTANVTDMNCMFNGCYALTSVPLFNTANVTDMNNMFGNCAALTSVPLFNTANVTDMNSMFNYCYALTSVPLFNTANVTDMNNMFGNCAALTSVPLFNTANVTNMSYMFYFCPALTSVPLFNTANVTNMNGMFNYCPNLQTGALSNTKVNISYQNCLLNRQSIVDIFNVLASAIATIDVSNNYGASDLTPADRAIAVNKGWTVLS